MSVSDIKEFSKELKELFEKNEYTINTAYVGKFNHYSYLYFDVISINKERISFDFYGDPKTGIIIQNIDGVCSRMDLIQNLLLKYSNTIEGTHTA